MEHILSVIGSYALAALFGGMLFFPAVVAPTVFKALEPEPAGVFLRKLFPSYYIFIIASSAIAATAFFNNRTISIGLLLVAGTTVLVRQLLVPRINAWRDQELSGDASAAAKFKHGHRISVLINIAQLFFVSYAAFVMFV
ncbi:MAG: DUF4149 domain-containing protein [Pseudomonadota bacterium]